MTYAYDEMYLETAMNNLGDTMEYVSDNLRMSKDEFMSLFIASGIAEDFGNGNPAYIMGMSGAELANAVLKSAGIKRKILPVYSSIYKAADYWCGWILAYYQWRSKRPFQNIMRYISMKDIELMYAIYHEAPEEKFYDTVEQMIKETKEPTRLQVMRKQYGITQKELANKSGVTLRSIQMYEQRNKDINKASLATVISLAKTLGCKIEDLIEY
ncbi:MAG: helix-turn-helix transcriptional regulator [Firmicutes bacterium]|nr:helix-turn-helix transcriptional regulator [Bacillota bacterium]